MKTWVFLLSSLFALSLSTMAIGCGDDGVPRDPEDLDEQLLIIDNDAGVADSDDDVDSDDDQD